VSLWHPKDNLFSEYALNPQDRAGGDGAWYLTYAGSSMNPTLRRPDLLEVAPYAGKPVRVGDVILFSPPDYGGDVVHRVSRIAPQGIRTRGDNNDKEDPYVLVPGDVMGQVVAAWRGQKRRAIAGGRVGRVTGHWARWQLAADRSAERLFSPLRGILVRWGALRLLIPAHLRPRVVVFGAGQSKSWQVLTGSTVVGRYDFARRQWCVKWPFRPFVDESSLPEPPQEAIRDVIV
jgi:hypothetical protein